MKTNDLDAHSQSVSASALQLETAGLNRNARVVRIEAKRLIYYRGRWPPFIQWAHAHSNAIS